MKEDVNKAFNAIIAAVEQYRGTKQDHILLQQYLELIKGELLTGCTCNKPEVIVESNDATE